MTYRDEFHAKRSASVSSSAIPLPSSVHVFESDTIVVVFDHVFEGQSPVFLERDAQHAARRFDAPPFM